MNKIALLYSAVALALLLALAAVTCAQVAAADAAAVQATPVGSGFTYQGQLKQGGAPVNDPCSMAFRLYDQAAGGNQVGSPLTHTVPVSNGLFTVNLDFGSGIFTGDARWLEVRVKCGSDPVHTPLGRQPLTAAPYALALPGLWTQPNVTSTNLIGGYNGNSVTTGVVGAAIGGGGATGAANRVTDNYGVVGGGAGNVAGNSAAPVTDTQYATVGGGITNTASANYATVAGGKSNTASGVYAAVGGGANNTANGYVAIVCGGAYNVASDYYATVGGGGYSTASNWYATVSGGGGNNASSGSATVGGGWHNTASGEAATVAGGQYNTAGGSQATVSGGITNTASGSQATVSGGITNTASGDYAAVGGGAYNTASGPRATVGGGDVNTASGMWATVGGGLGNTASGEDATVGGGRHNTASSEVATVPGGAAAVADHYGQLAYASGSFYYPGDAQFSIYVLRWTSSGTSWTDLYLDGSSALLTVADGRTLTFDVLVAGHSDIDESAGYRFQGVIENVVGTTAFIGTPTKTVLGEDDTAWDAQVVADDTNDALAVQVKGNGEWIRWVATVQTAEVAW